MHLLFVFLLFHVIVRVLFKIFRSLWLVCYHARLFNGLGFSYGFSLISSIYATFFCNKSSRASLSICFKTFNAYAFANSLADIEFLLSPSFSSFFLNNSLILKLTSYDMASEISAMIFDILNLY